METNPEVLAQSVKSGVERVRNSNKDYAFILESTMNEYFNQRRPCTTVKVCSASIDFGTWLKFKFRKWTQAVIWLCIKSERIFGIETDYREG